MFHLEHFSKQLEKSQEKKIDLIKSILQKSPEKNDLDLFFSSMCKTVQKFVPKEQALLKFKIHQLVSEKEIELLCNTQVEDISIEILDDFNDPDWFEDI